MILRMTLDQVNYVNIFAMILSAVIAFSLPFELVLWSYAFLGPAHYLTQISWMKDRNYFIPIQGTAIFYVFMTLGVIFTSYDKIFFWASVAYALTHVICASSKSRVVVFSIMMILYVVVEALASGALGLFFLLLPTVIHVFIFTGLFVLFGALKSQSTSAQLSLVVFVLCGASFFVFPMDGVQLAVKEGGVELFAKTRDGILSLLPFSEDFSVNVMAFLSYAYTYHYLNWFLKVDVIKWADVSKKRWVMILCLYLFSIGLYLIDYKLGFALLAFLSLAHVLLEFPLNVQVIKGIGGHFLSRR